MTKKQLERILNSHRDWVNHSLGGNRACFSGKTCKGIDLSATYLINADFRAASLHRAKFQGADFTDAELAYADFTQVQLYKANFQNATLIGADFSSANLSGVCFQGAVLTYANFSGAHLQGADFTGANIDFSAWPLWCGSLGAKVDIQIVRQLLYHLCALNCDNRGWRVLRKTLLRMANKFHRVENKNCPKLR